MTKEDIINSIAVGDVFKNYGKGTSIILKIDEEKIVYMRGNSRLSLKFQDFIDAYNKFAGTTCKTNDLKAFRPKIFDSKKNGHSCNCTFMFKILENMGLATVYAKGVAYHPFYAE